MSLERWHLDRAGKLMTLLWQIFLIAGPTFAAMRRFCNRIRSITTDFGVERGLANSADVLDLFYSFIDPKWQPWPELRAPSGLMFPRCMYMPGWKHLVDNLIQRALNSFRWFASFIGRYKSLIQLLRQTTVISTIAREWRSRNLSGAAAVLEGAAFPSFAAWRWGTLDACCCATASILDTLVQNFNATPFANVRDRTMIRNVVSALGDATWKRQHQFVHWFCRWLGDLLSWAGGCSCHPKRTYDDPKAKQEADTCPWKGRRLPEAYDKVMSTLREGLAEANNWAHDLFRIC